MGFTTHDSILTPGKAIWSADVRDDLYQRFVLNPDESSHSFLEKLRGQLQDAPAETVQLAGELLFVQLLTPAGIGRKKKCELVETVLAWSPQPVELSEELKQAFNRGLANDMSFMHQRPFQIAFLLEVFRKWDELETARRKELLEDPWEFKAFLSDVPVRAAQPMREMLCHFVHPEHFEPISSRKHKEKIVEAFRDQLGSESGDRDRDLYAIRQKLTDAHGEGFSFYARDVLTKWREDVPPEYEEPWRGFLEWGQRVRTSEIFDQWELGYKYETANNVANARELLLGGGEDWLAQLKTAFTKSEGLTAWQMHDKFLRWCEANADTANNALLALWSEDGKSDELRMRAFIDQLPQDVAKGAGTRANLLSFLLMGVDAKMFPIYRPTPFKAAYKLSRYRRLSPGADAVQQYRFALEFLDEFIKAWPNKDEPLNSRLEAQGVVWGITKWDGKPPDWSDEDSKPRFVVVAQRPMLFRRRCKVQAYYRAGYSSPGLVPIAGVYRCIKSTRGDVGVCCQ